MHPLQPPASPVSNHPHHKRNSACINVSLRHINARNIALTAETAHMTLKWIVIVLTVLGAGAGTYAWIGAADVGQGRFFADQSYHFQTLRALTDIAADGADTSEVLETIKHIRSGDAQGWFAAWTATADRVSARAETIKDPLGRGRALLRAHNYYRTAEFFLPPDDPKRPSAAGKNRRAFYAGLDALGVRYQRIVVPYGEAHHLDAVYYPAADGPSKKRSLIVFGGGFDSTIEELYFALVKDANEHGYDVLTYDGPGQGAMLREQGLTFTHEWEKPVRAVIDSFLGGHPRPAKMVLVGMSMGGYFAPRAAAFDQRFDGVAAYDVMFDAGQSATRFVPPAVTWLRAHGLGAAVDLMVRLKAAWSPGFRWAIASGMWTLGTKHPLDSAIELRKYTLDGVAPRITADLLILAGTEDHFVPIEQVTQFEKALTGARSITTRVYDRASGGAEHCQLGAQTLWHADFFDWMDAKFEADS
ncbi:alpha/beta fold hydrolase [Bradyrhizobium sp. 48]|uniref:alpha/beta hydrolase family protein n=1 Tax=Bradyrhizobium sp. 48 TaxID=2782676 RepID=UPI001FF9B882